jgi:hypothetical protein
MKRICLIIPVLIVIALFGCVPKASPATEDPTPTITFPGTKLFRSEQFFLSVQLPQKWASAEGPEHMAKPYEGQVAFNSWGEANFWAREIQSGNSFTYSPGTVISQIPEGGAYVALVRVNGPPGDGSNLPEEYDQNYLSGLVTLHDWRLDASSTAEFVNFYKWSRSLTLWIGCKVNATETTVVELNNLLQSWKFDAIPAGDTGWAITVARRILPEKVEPSKFSASMHYFQTVARQTEVEVGQDNTVHFRFTYYWNLPFTPKQGTIDAPSDTYHWWEIDVLTSGKAVLTAQGGTVLPK